jgi:hypothetical protein
MIIRAISTLGSIRALGRRGNLLYFKDGPIGFGLLDDWIEGHVEESGGGRLSVG